ncbi:TY-Chap domain-containing protein [Actinomyces bowdenii]|uniref:TY-Chap N-terminal domain-containing protein n=1 Tax=Actinomyces bowdenii TaxID=131109 RepID=A0A853EG68_9ACTO|nr:hypothetical protein [Actinomyces bowdenii]MBF0696234.1 hypothetical protein [Actinomyces bowdenii]MCR2052035.1 hypothetical protein [Actinomyces bowdenii]NYS68407.1 hypothetical protein [Actinomyces bowdenii]
MSQPPIAPHQPHGADSFASRVDLGSWARFTPSLGDFLEEACRPRSTPGATSGATVLLTAPAVVADPEDLPRGRGLLRRRGHGPAGVSPEPPGVVLVGRGDGVQLAAPTRDARGRALLGRSQCRALEDLGWQGGWQSGEAMSRLLPDGASAAEHTTRILIEVLRVPHPADLDHLLHEH